MISAAVYLFGCLVYWFWASGKIQPWAQKRSEINENKQKVLDAATYVGYTSDDLEMSE